MPRPTWALFLTMFIPLWPPCTHPLMATSSRIMHHFHCTKMAPTVTRSQPNRASLGCVGTGASCIPQISINCKILFYQYEPTFLKNTFSTLLNQCHVDLRQFWRWKGVKHSISMVFLFLIVLWVSVCYLLCTVLFAG